MKQEVRKGDDPDAFVDERQACGALDSSKESTDKKSVDSNMYCPIVSSSSPAFLRCSPSLPSMFVNDLQAVRLLRRNWP